MEGKRLRIFIFTVAILLAGFSQPTFGQSGNEEKKEQKAIDKSIKVFYKKGYSEGIENLRGYMDKVRQKGGIPSLSVYETWVQMEYLKYLSDDELLSLLDFSVEGDSASQEGMDSLTLALMANIKDYPKRYFIDVCRQSTIESFSFTADMYLNTFLIEYDPDTAVSEKAKAYFTEGEEFYEKDDYELAELNYRKAINEAPGYYKAYLYLGNSFWAREDYDSAIVYFTIAKNMYPDLIEPRKKIVDALIDQGLYYRAKKECLEALTVYPGFDVKIRMQQILMIENKYMEDHRFIRYFYPNNIKTANQRSLNGIWYDYSSAKNKISKYCNEDGIIEPNEKTTDLYLEVYSFRQLFEKNDEGNDLPEYMKFGYKMMEEGFLEPYVFISMFHVDIYPQFKHYMSFQENREKSMEYVDKYLIETYTE
jgi:tetratricopeptide (TPR) repeat protein